MQLSHLLKSTHFLLFSITNLKNHYHDAFKNNLGYILTSSKKEFHFIFLHKVCFQHILTYLFKIYFSRAFPNKNPIFFLQNMPNKSRMSMWHCCTISS
jgi:hypothetical protein